MHPVAETVLQNLSMWSLGFLTGWSARTLARWARGELMRHQTRNTVIAAATTLVIALLTTAVVVLAEIYGDDARLQVLWNACRSLNYPLGVLVSVGVVYRVCLMAFDRPRRRDARALHVAAWMLYIAANLVAAAMTSHHYELAGVDATWVSGLRTVLMSGAVVLTVWWPHSRPEETR